MTDRDTFAAAALTGLCSMPPMSGPDKPQDFAAMAYAYADAMLRCRGGGDCPLPDNEPNHDAAPAARAESDEDRTDKAATSHRRDGTGDTPKPINDCVSDRSKPINGPYTDSRVWETQVHTPAPHATPGECSMPREGTEGPAAWATFCPNGSTASVYIGRKPPHAEPLYRQPPCQDFSPKNLTLTDAEREAIEEAIKAFKEFAGDDVYVVSLNGLLERMGGGG